MSNFYLERFIEHEELVKKGINEIKWNMFKCVPHGSFIWPPNVTVRNKNLKTELESARPGKDKIAWFPVSLLEYFPRNEDLNVLLFVLVADS